jgi:hypothetical protein
VLVAVAPRDAVNEAVAVTAAFGLPAADRGHMTPPRIDTIRTLESTRIRSARRARSGTYPLGHPSPTSVNDGG